VALKLLIREPREKPGAKDLGALKSRKGTAMLYYALVFLLIAVVAGILGFGGVVFAAAGIAKILFFLFLVLFVVGLVTHLARRGI
jgi:uncharacterized membrane protein YtjA (UPF0391 family)